MHFYVYDWRDGRDGRKGYYFYERTCGSESAAKSRVKELGGRATYLVDHLIKGAFY